MVAATFEWDTLYMLQHFGWRAAIAVFVNATLLTLVVRSALKEDADSTPPSTRRERPPVPPIVMFVQDRKSTRLNSSHVANSYAVFCLKNKKKKYQHRPLLTIQE